MKYWKSQQVDYFCVACPYDDGMVEAFLQDSCSIALNMIRLLYVDYSLFLGQFVVRCSASRQHEPQVNKCKDFEEIKCSVIRNGVFWHLVCR